MMETSPNRSARRAIAATCSIRARTLTTTPNLRHRSHSRSFSNATGMKAARLHNYHEALKVEQIDEPKITGPLDVIVKIGAAGLCRTDLHIQEGQWAEKSGVELPYVPGHENAGWVHEIGSGVSNVEVGDTVIVHPFISCGLCRPCRCLFA